MLAPRGVAVALVSLLVSVAAISAAMPGHALAAVPWPASTGLVLAEAVTGGASASDEYVEIYNAGASPIDLGGCELVYVTASGATTTRKAAFSSPVPLAPGAHLLVANSAGVYGPLADATYTGGLASDGGSLALRHVGGEVIDAVSWGTASNSFVEGAVAPAPPAQSSLERRPGGTSGNWLDTNSNASDWVVRSNPVPQSLASAPVPAPTSPPSTTPISTATSTSTAGEPTEMPSPAPFGSAPSDSAPATAAPSVSASPTSSHTASPTASPTPTPTGASPAPTDPAVDLESIAAARAQSPGTIVHLAGAVTAPVGPVGADNLFAIADSSGGIFVRLSAPVDGLEIGRSIEIVGALSAPYGQLEVRELEWLQLGATDAAPIPIAATLPEIGEWLEGSLVTVEGTIDSATTESGRLAITLGDGETALRVLADPLSGIFKADVIRGEQVTLIGIVGQRATALGRLDGYRLWLRARSDLVNVAAPSPSPSAVPSATPARRPAATPTPTPTPTLVYRDLATGLAARGRTVDVEATVTAAAGVIDWGGPTIVVDDGTAAVAVVLPAGVTSPKIGAGVRVVGKTGSLHSGRRVVATLVESGTAAGAVQPRPVAVALGPEHEWQLVAACGRVQRLTKAGSRWRADLTVDGKIVAVLGEPGAGISPSGLVAGRLVMATGIVRRSTSDPSVFQLLPRSGADLVLGPAPDSSAVTAGAAAGHAFGSVASGVPAVGADARLTTVSAIPGNEGSTVTVAGLIVEPGEPGAPAGAATASATTPTTAMLDDGTGRIRLGGSAAADAIALLEPGDAVEVSGQVARDMDGWLIEVDPDRILALAGTTPGTTASSGVVSNGASPVAAAAASDASGEDELSTAGAQARGLAHPSDGAGAPNSIEVVALLGGSLAVVVCLGFAAAQIARGRRLRIRAKRPAGLGRRARDG